LRACRTIVEPSQARRTVLGRLLCLSWATWEALQRYDLLERLDASRSRRNEASYASMLIAQASVDAAKISADDRP
jgi:hypothetical protein